MKWAQIALLVYLILVLVVAARSHGQVDRTPNKFWHGLLGALILGVLGFFAGAFDQVFR